MNNELVSIIMSVYDGDSTEFLSESIQSIIDQDYANIEIVLIGDGLENSLLISNIESIVNNNKIIRYFPQDINLGLASCMNKAIDLSEGKFLARMDADDIMESNRITLQSQFRHNPSVCMILKSARLCLEAISSKLIFFADCYLL